MHFLRKATFLISASILAGGAVFAAETQASKPTRTDVATSADLRRLMDQFNQRRDAVLANREALLKQLREATGEQKKAILQKMQAQQKELEDAQRALGKQIRDEMRKLPKQSPPGAKR